MTDKKPFSNGDMKRIGQALKEGREPNPDKFAQVMDWHDQLISEVAAIAFETIQIYVDSSQELALNLRLETVPLPTMRIKSDDTIAQKLVRLSTKLDRIQDFAGCRFDLQCTPSAQLEIARHLETEFKRRGANVQIKDYLEHTQHGYRGVHLHLTSEAGRCELQIRTLLQAAWANLNEVLGDLFGRQHRYRDIDETHPGYDLISEAAILATDIKAIEEISDRLKMKLSLLNDPSNEGLRAQLNTDINESELKVIKSLNKIASKLGQEGALQ